MNILVTGVSRGVGIAICHSLLEQGNTVYGVSRSHSDGVRELEGEYPATFRFRSVDLQDSDAARRAIFSKDFVSNSVPLHGLVNNAALAYDDIITNLNLGRLTAMFQTNVFTPMLLTKYAIRNMIFNRIGGSIVHISSVSAHTGYKGLAMYASSKGAMEAFSRNTAREWGERGIRSNVVVPGFMDTAMSSTLTPEQKERIYKRTSLKSDTKVESVAATVAFLLSEGAGSITGQNIHVDNGTI